MPAPAFASSATALMEDGGKPIDADILLTHCHYDHVIGIPFFAPFYQPQHQLPDLVRQPAAGFQAEIGDADA